MSTNEMPQNKPPLMYKLSNVCLQPVLITVYDPTTALHPLASCQLLTLPRPQRAKTIGTCHCGQDVKFPIQDH